MRRMHVIFIALTVILALCFLIIYLDYNSPASDIARIQPWYKLLLNKKAENSQNNDNLILAILGTDERNNEKSRSDVIIVLKYIPKESKVIAVSVPRDSKLSIPGKGLNKINAAYAFGGPKLQVAVLEDLFNIKGMKYVHINFEGFREIIDSLGGIEVNAQKDFKGSGEEKQLFAKKGKNILMGNDLLEYVRYRDDREGDFGRIKRQQEVLYSFYSSITKKENIPNLPQVAMSVARNIDSDMNIFFMMRNAEILEKPKTFDFEFYTLETSSKKENGIWYEIIDEKNLDFISGLLQN